MKVSFHGIDPSKLTEQEITINNTDALVNTTSLIRYLRTDLKMKNIFVTDDMPDGMLCMINGVDIECCDDILRENDHITFIYSLHGG